MEIVTVGGRGTLGLPCTPEQFALLEQSAPGAPAVFMRRRAAWFLSVRRDFNTMRGRNVVSCGRPSMRCRNGWRECALEGAGERWVGTRRGERPGR